MTDSKFRIIQTPVARYLRVEGDLPPDFVGERAGDGYNCPLNQRNAAAIRRELPWAAPTLVGGKKSIGLGDRLGIATPGHLRAVREGDMFPVLAQQSMREMQRAKRTPQDVLDHATWGVIEADYRDGWGCDADHLKTTEDIDACHAAGFISYTLDPGAYVDDSADTLSDTELQARFNALPWDALGTTPDASSYVYVNEGRMDEAAHRRAAVKYGRALAHVKMLADYIAVVMNGEPYDLEISVDETASVTSLAEHRYIALELRRLGIPFTGLAPRFVGTFEKGVDYIGSVVDFEASYREHAALARELGGYKLSIHSGSDKFSVFPIISKYSGDSVHVKTSGTSWLEALRVVAAVEPEEFRQILDLAIEGYPQNRASYHVSADPARIPPTDDLGSLLDQFDAREVLHVAFGPALAQFRDPIYEVLNTNREAYYRALHAHFRRHILPFRRE